MRIFLKKIATLFLITALCMYDLNYISPPIRAYASVGEKDLQDNINKAVKMIEKNFQDHYDSVLLDLKQKIKDYGWDYEMTMMSFYDNGNPYKKMDYTRLVAALSTVRELASYDSLILKNAMLTDVDFLNVSSESERLDDGKMMGNITLTLKDPEYVFDFFNIDTEVLFKGKKIKDIYESKVKAIDAAVYGVDLKQNTFVRTRYNVGSQKIAETILKTILSSNVSDERKALIKTAFMLLGQIPYQWGGKAKGPGYGNSWWLYNDKGEQQGLDCSGFVQWAYMTAGFDKSVTDNLLSTSITANSFQKIDENRLLPGDLGLFNNGSLSSNHVGIFLGDGYWIHCSSSKNTVVIARDVGFNVFVRAIDSSDDEEIDNMYSFAEIPDENETESSSSLFSIGNKVSAEDDDVFVLSQLIHHEAGNQGFNGLVAVAETVMNRVKSTFFPDTISEVVYEDNQFTNASEIKGIQPTKEELDIARDVIEGRLSILNNEKVMYFRNPTITDGIGSSVKKNWGKLEWYMAVGAHAFYLQP